MFNNTLHKILDNHNTAKYLRADFLDTDSYQQIQFSE